MSKKYELIPSDIEGLFRIKALKDFSNIMVGDIGGYVSGEHNLSQNYDCWIYDDAIVMGDAVVRNHATIHDVAVIRGKVEVYDEALIDGYAKVRDRAWIHGRAQVHDGVKIQDEANIYDNAIIKGTSVIHDKTVVYDNAVICDAVILNNAVVGDHAQVQGNSIISDNVVISGTAVVRDKAKVHGNAIICGDAVITSIKDYIVFKNWWSSGRYFTWTRFNNMWKVGCFYGTGDKLIAKAYNDSEESGREYEKIVKYVESILENQRLNHE